MSEDNKNKNKKEVTIQILDRDEDKAISPDKSSPDSGDDLVIEAKSYKVDGKEKKIPDFTPIIAPSRDIQRSQVDPLTQYIREISRYRLLTREEEDALTAEFAETGDIEIAKTLVQSNLRLVVKIALEYKTAYQNVMDLIQEGNIGLMKAVSKFNPDKGAKLSYYASWWIKSYILKFILDNFRLVKIGTTKEQKKLFYNLMKEKEKLEQQGIKPEPKLISQQLGVSEKAVIEMEQRLAPESGDLSLDYPLGSESGDQAGALFQDILDSGDQAIDEQLGELQDLEILKEQLQVFLGDLKDRDREIFKDRLLSEAPQTLQEIANRYGVSKERIRQIEARLLNKLKVYMSEHLG